MTGLPAYPADWATLFTTLDRRVREAYTAATRRPFVPPLHARKVNDGPPANATITLTDDPDLTVPVQAGTVYELRCLLIYAADPAADLKVGWTAPADATLTWWRTGLNAAGAVDTPALTLADTVALAGVTSASTRQAAQLGGILTVGTTGGHLALRTAQQTSHASDATVYAPSLLILERL
ncbi:hypothetical protein [Thermomonospora cellulosilytica]|uniref:Uncharacterized protein n=1 Tax=Thermomonospora cellulosilytica TaxID=1411118 RepID=A0A7W3MXN1_9ACTN|nr:hypothetical protein [Thermomonospora cellulosilytica]MBA9003726.1 hypothetical protein [Thermomonospora cellulosilytica]